MDCSEALLLQRKMPFASPIGQLRILNLERHSLPDRPYLKLRSGISAVLVASEASERSESQEDDLAEWPATAGWPHTCFISEDSGRALERVLGILLDLIGVAHPEWMFQVMNS